MDYAHETTMKKLKMLIAYIPYLLKQKHMQNLNKDQALEKLNELKSNFDKQAKELQTIIENADKKLSAIDRLDSVEDAIAELGEEDILVKEYRKMQKADLSIKTLAGQRILIWVKAVNEDWIPNWDNTSEYKYLIWFDMRKEAGKGFFDSDYGSWSCGGGSLSVGQFYKSKDLALRSGGKPKIEQEYYNYMKG